MNPDWQSFLENSGAVIEHGRVMDFGDREGELRAALQGDIITGLSHTGVITATGDEVESLLQGQFCNDIRRLDHGHSQISAWCNPKGRILVSFRLFRRNDRYCLHLPLTQVDDTIQRLRMYVLMSGVEIEDASNELIHMGCSGPQLADRLAELIGEIPQHVDEVVQDDALTLIRIPGPVPRFELFADLPGLERIWSALADDAVCAGPEAWTLLDIRSGIPNILPATREAFVPQMVNLHAIDGLSFQKGCYTGQEIVARMQYLGKLKRRMYRARVVCDTAPAPGDGLYAPQAEGAQGAGMVVEAVTSPAGGYELLAVIQISVAEEEVRLHDADGPILQLLDLPYEVKTEQAG